MVIKNVLKLAVKKLDRYKIKNPHLDAEILLSEILERPREFLLARTEYELTPKQLFDFQSHISRRIKGEPVAYLVGYKEFYGNKFLVNKNVLIPRPETELMVEEAFSRIIHNAKRVTIIDIGTGSGNIIISLAKLINNKLKVKNYKLWGTDISPKTLITAKKNAKINRINNIKFIQGDLLDPLSQNSKIFNQKSKIIMLANLPYLTPAQTKNLPTIQAEPKLALDGGKDGLALYEKLFKQIKTLRVTRYALYVMCEIDPQQTDRIKKLVKKYFPQAKTTIKKDLAGLNRLAIINI